MSIHNYIESQTKLAKTYAKDGAFRTAAQRLRKLADAIDEHVQTVEDDMRSRQLRIAKHSNYGKFNNGGNVNNSDKPTIVESGPEAIMPPRFCDHMLTPEERNPVKQIIKYDPVLDDLDGFD